MHKTLFHLSHTFCILTTNLFYTFWIHHFICPFREQPPVSSVLLPFPLIKYNSIPYTFFFLLKTWILLSFSKHELYFISSFYRFQNINHPKLFFHFYFYSLKVHINLIVNISQFTWAWNSLSLILLEFRIVLFVSTYLEHGTTDWFKIGKEVCQSCILSQGKLYKIYLSDLK